MACANRRMSQADPWGADLKGHQNITRVSKHNCGYCQNYIFTRTLSEITVGGLKEYLGKLFGTESGTPGSLREKHTKIIKLPFSSEKVLVREVCKSGSSLGYLEQQKTSEENSITIFIIPTCIAWYLFKIKVE